MNSHQYIPERIINKVNKVTSSMMANGLHQFYEMFADYLITLRAHKILRVEDDDFRVISIEDLRIPLIFCSFLLAIALIIFLIESIFSTQISNE